MPDILKQYKLNYFNIVIYKINIIILFNLKTN